MEKQKKPSKKPETLRKLEANLRKNMLRRKEFKAKKGQADKED